MGLLDQVLGGLVGGSSRETGGSQITDVLTELLAPRGSGRNQTGGGLGDLIGGMAGHSGHGQSNSGGLGGLIDAFTRSGQGDVADSWVRSGQNKQVAPHQVEQALGVDEIDRLARQTGLPRDVLLQELSKHLPNAVDRMTPQGRMPKPEEMNHW